MQSMLKARDTLFRVWELAVSFLGLPRLPRVQREKTNRGELANGERSGLQTRTATTKGGSLWAQMKS